MRRSMMLAIFAMAVCCLAGAQAGAISFTHNAYVLAGSTISTATGPAEIAFGEGGSFSGTGSWAGYDWDITGQQTGSAVSYTATSAAIPGFSAQQNGSSGDFAFGAYYSIVDIGLDYGVALFTSPGATSWVGTWNLEVKTLGGPNSGAIEITSADLGVLSGYFTSWPTNETPSFTGTYSPDGTFQIVVPDWGHCTFYGTYGTGWHGNFSATGAEGYFIDNNMVPEPSALVVLLGGMASIAGFVSRKR